jgi:predicted KAP-like P-loop ATPase
MSIQSSTSSSGTLRPDRPRKQLAEDELGREGFVRSLWNALRNHDAEEALVLSLAAPWGDGKTTIKNMVEDLEATEGQPKKLLFVHFNPWEWAAQNQVATSFFNELASQMDQGIGDGLEENFKKHLIRLIRQLPKALGLVEVAATGISLAAVPINPLVAVWAAALAETVKTGKEQLGQVEQHGASLSSPNAPSVQAVKAEVREQFVQFRKKTNRTIVVFIDDIDRLSGDEIRQVLQLVKVNADFPGLIFVLLFDRHYVERRLRRHFGSDAASFLEKIVQVELAIPRPSEDQLYHCLRRNVDEVLIKRTGYRAIFEEARLREAYDLWFHAHLRNPRNYGRLLSSWAFRLDVFPTDAAEVNPVDLLILEGLSLHESRVYLALSKAEAELFPNPDRDPLEVIIRNFDHKEGDPSPRMQAVNRIAQAAKEADRRPLVAVLKFLLGVTGDGFDEVSPSEASLRTRSRRFSDGRFFRRYFRLSIDSGEVAKATINRLVSLTERPKEFVAQWTELERQGVLLDALDQLMAEDLPQTLALPDLLAEVLNWREEKGFADEHPIQMDLDHRLVGLYEKLLGPRQGEARLAVLQSTVARTVAVFALKEMVLHEQLKRRHRDKSGSKDTSGILDQTSERCLCEKVAQRLLRKFQETTPTGRHFEAEGVTWGWHHANALKVQIAEELVKTPGGTATLLRGTLGQFGNASSVRNNWLQFRSAVAGFISVESLAKAVTRFKTQVESQYTGATEDVQTLLSMASAEDSEATEPSEAAASADGEADPAG